MWHGRIFKKKAGSSIKYENVVKITVFWDFLKKYYNDFYQTRSNSRRHHYRAFATNRKSKSLSDHPKTPKMCHFRRFFGLFSKSRIEILLLKRQNVEENSTEQTQKTAALNLFKKSRYLVPGGILFSTSVEVITSKCRIYCQGRLGDKSYRKRL